MPDENILDPAAISGLRDMSPGDGGAFFRELIEIFLQDTPGRLAEIDSAMAANNAPLLTRAAHSIKGSSGNFGAVRLSKFACAIEMKGKQGAIGDLADDIAALKLEYARVKGALEAELARTV